MEEPLEYYAINTTTTIERKDDSSTVSNENLAKQHFSNTAHRGFEGVSAK